MVHSGEPETSERGGHKPPQMRTVNLRERLRGPISRLNHPLETADVCRGRFHSNCYRHYKSIGQENIKFQLLEIIYQFCTVPCSLVISAV